MELEDINRICNKLNIEGEVIGVSIMSSGHINSTFKIDVLQDKKLKSYIVQQINTFVFQYPEELMQNIMQVTDFIRSRSGRKSNKTLKFLEGENGKGYAQIGDGYYRAYEFVENSETYDITIDPGIIYETGFAFGEFQNFLREFDSSKLFETIPDFHNTPSRFDQLEVACANDVKGRKDSASYAIKGYRSRRELAEQMYNLYHNNQLPARVTHNDTKCNNVLFDKKTKKHICVIDLDTVMPGLVGFDFGDGIRFIASTATEDEQNIDKVALDLGKFESFTKGFFDGVDGALTKNEVDTLALGAITMTLECGARFLTDYLNGDTYFKTSYPGHNFDRAWCQLALAEDMIAKLPKMQEIVEKYANEKHSQKI